MASSVSKGTCSFCHGVFGKASMTRHLTACRQRATALEEESKQRRARKTAHFHIVVDGLYLRDYWLHLEVPKETTLRMLDSFLRKIWLECCGHLSQFEINNARYQSYESDSMWLPSKGMDVEVGKVLSPGLEFTHEYDFGSTTYLRLRVISEYERATKDRGIHILARNELPVMACSVCGQPATQLCQECMYNDDGTLCESCAEQHECGEEMLLPIANSPRVGVCGYTGQN